jgi:dTDP-4-amino-4,6-dideoxygalactose transaminase
LGELPIGLPITPDGRTHVFHQYTLDVGGARDAIVADLKAAGVGADIYYPIPVHRQSYIMERGLHADLPVTDGAAARTLALPMFPGLTDGEQEQVIAAVRDAVGRHLGAGGTAGSSAATAGIAAR